MDVDAVEEALKEAARQEARGLSKGLIPVLEVNGIGIEDAAAAEPFLAPHVPSILAICRTFGEQSTQTKRALSIYLLFPHCLAHLRSSRE